MQLLSKRITRRYTPPTCTLEVTGETSALSQWTSRPVLKNLQFQLSLDDPRQPGEQPVQIQGDRDQLEILSETVETYVQTLLNQPSHSLPLGLVLDGHPDELETSINSTATTGGVSLQCQTLLFHSLDLGNLAGEITPHALQLSVTQLFDLATALEEYTAEAEVPVATSSTKPLAWLSETPIWARSAALALLAVGVSMAVLELVNQNSPSQLARQDATTPPAQPNDQLLVPPSPPPEVSPVIPPLATAPAAPFPSPPAIPAPNQGPNSAAVPNQSVPPPPTPAVNPGSAPSIVVQPQEPQSGSTQGIRPPELPPEPEGPDPFSITAQPAPESARSTAQPQVERLADTIPQVAQVRSYFQQRWQPPESLNQTLEYTLILNPDGSLQRTVPLGEAAATYLDRTPIPLANDPFVSPLEGKGALIRLVLSPDGDVQTFLQPGN